MANLIYGFSPYRDGRTPFSINAYGNNRTDSVNFVITDTACGINIDGVLQSSSTLRITVPGIKNVQDIKFKVASDSDEDIKDHLEYNNTQVQVKDNIDSTYVILYILCCDGTKVLKLELMKNLDNELFILIGSSMKDLKGSFTTILDTDQYYLCDAIGLFNSIEDTCEVLLNMNQEVDIFKKDVPVGQYDEFHIVQTDGKSTDTLVVMMSVNHVVYLTCIFKDNGKYKGVSYGTKISNVDLGCSTFNFGESNGDSWIDIRSGLMAFNHENKLSIDLDDFLYNYDKSKYDIGELFDYQLCIEYDIYRTEIGNEDVPVCRLNMRVINYDHDNSLNKSYDTFCDKYLNGDYKSETVEM